MNKTIFIVLGVLVAVGLAGFVMTQGLKFTKTANNANSSVEQSTDNSNSDQTNTVTFDKTTTTTPVVEVAGDEYSYSPSTINLKKGEKTRITFKNVGKAPHNFVAPDLGITTAVIGGGEEVSVEVTPDKTGSFSFYCSVGNHKSLGMEGKVTVE